MHPTRSLYVPLALLSSLIPISLAQFTVQSNDTSSFPPIAVSPRFLLNGTEFPAHFGSIDLAPLDIYATLSKSEFLAANYTGTFFNVDANNANDIPPQQTLAFVSCDTDASVGYLSQSYVFSTALNSANSYVVILYSQWSLFCNVTQSLDPDKHITGVFTTLNPVNATALANLNLGVNSPGAATILPDLRSYTNVTASSTYTSTLGSPTTAVAMIILYSITGVITALFIAIIISGAIRAHRHPERYGPRVRGVRGGQSRAKGIARAMLETLPIVRFGDDEEDNSAVKAPSAADVEMSPISTGGVNPVESTPAEEGAVAEKINREAGEEPFQASGTPAATPATALTRSATPPSSSSDPGHISGEVEPSEPHAHPHSHSPVAAGDGTQDDGTLGCSICTEDFARGEEVRVLPCKHKFHPECVDPWLLNVSGTCPLCRIDLRPKEEQTQQPPLQEGDPAADVPAAVATLPPPLDAGASSQQPHRRDTFVSLSRIAVAGTLDESIAALRRLRDERRGNNSYNTAMTRERSGGVATAAGEEERRRGLAGRLRDRFRVRTTVTVVYANVPEDGATSPALQPVRSR